MFPGSGNLLVVESCETARNEQLTAITGVTLKGQPSLLRRVVAPGVVAGGCIALSGALVGGLVLAVALTPQFGSWTAHGAVVHHHVRP
jgi:hypothetical protein